MTGNDELAKIATLALAVALMLDTLAAIIAVRRPKAGPTPPHRPQPSLEPARAETLAAMMDRTVESLSESIEHELARREREEAHRRELAEFDRLLGREPQPPPHRRTV